MDQPPDEVVLLSDDSWRVEEWSLVLLSQGISTSSAPSDDGRRELCVAAADELAAREVLRAYAQDPPLHGRERAIPPGVTGWDWRLGAFSAAALIEFYFFTGPLVAPRAAWFQQGDCAWELLGREPWRAVTALTLHADGAHLVGNSIFAVFVLGAVGSRFGGGLALLLVLAGGALGNVLSCAWQGAGYHVIGASTAVFAAMGLTGGALAVERAALGRWARPWVPVGLVICFFAYFGADPGAAIAAHLFGALGGLLLGMVAALLLRRPPRALVQGASGLVVLGMLTWSWCRAMRS